MHYDILAATVLAFLLAAPVRAMEPEETPRNVTELSLPVPPIERPVLDQVPAPADPVPLLSPGDGVPEVSRLSIPDASAATGGAALNPAEARFGQWLKRLSGSGASVAFDPVVTKALPDGPNAAEVVDMDVAEGVTYWIAADVDDRDPTSLRVADLNVQVLDEQGQELASDRRRNRSVLLSFQSPLSGRVAARFTQGKAAAKPLTFMLAIGREAGSGGPAARSADLTAAPVAGVSAPPAATSASENARRAAARFDGFQPAEVAAGRMEAGSNQEFKLTVKKDIGYRAVVDGDEMARNIDLQALDGSGQVIAEDTRSNRSARVVFFPKADGVVVLRVIMKRSLGTGGFALLAGDLAGAGVPGFRKESKAPEGAADDSPPADPIKEVPVVPDGTGTKSAASASAPTTGNAPSATEAIAVTAAKTEPEPAADLVEALAKARPGFQYEETLTKRLRPDQTGIATSLMAEPGRTYIILADGNGDGLTNLDLRLTSSDNALISEDKRPNREAEVRFNAQKKEAIAVRLELTGRERKSDVEIALKVGSAPTGEAAGKAPPAPAAAVKAP